MEASTLQAPVVPVRCGPSIGVSLLRLRSDEQLVALFRGGSDEAFRAIHDRYRQRLFAYTRQMLPGRQDAEDALQDVFVRAYSGLRANDRQLALRAWLYRVAHNRCVDELRRPLVSPTEIFDLISAPNQDPVVQADQRESLRRLIADVRRLPEQQRSALLMRELSGLSYAELAVALGTTVPAVKSLLVRARMALAQALEARDTACTEIREALILAQDNRTRPNAMARRHMRDCPGCREFRHDLRGVSRQLSALAPTLGPIGVLAKVLGFGFGSGAGGGAAAGGTAAAGGGTVAAGGATVAAGGAVGSGGALASAGALATGAGHVATLLVATVVTAGGAVEIQHTIAPTPVVRHHHARPVAHAQPAPVAQPPAAPSTQSYSVTPTAPVVAAPATAAPAPVHTAASTALAPASTAKTAKPGGAKAGTTKGAHGAKGGSGQGSASSTASRTGPSSSGSSSTGTSSTATSSTSATGSVTGTSGTSAATTNLSTGTTGGTSSSTSTEPDATESSASSSASSPATNSSGSSTSGQSTGDPSSSPTDQ